MDKDIPFEPLSRALVKMQSWLANNGESRLIIARHDITGMRRQVLPPHVEISLNLQRGPRVVSRSAPFAGGGRIDLANWPEAGMSEYNLPMLACVISGQADLRAADYFLHCRTGDFVFYPVGIPKCNGQKPHLVGHTEGRSCEVLWLNRVAPVMGLGCYMCQSHGVEHRTHLSDAECLSTNFLLGQIFDGFCEELQCRGKSLVSVEMLSLFLSLLKRDIDEGAVSSFAYTQSRTDIGQSNLYQPIEQACLYIDSHLDQRLTIDHVARQVYLSSTQFTRGFRQQTGQSFHEYLTQQRLKKAVQFLVETTVMVQHISKYVGIKPNQLRNLFREKYGCSPAEYRSKHTSL
jgi:AraC-like DNA-binding protein